MDLLSALSQSVMGFYDSLNGAGSCNSVPFKESFKTRSLFSRLFVCLFFAVSFLRRTNVLTQLIGQWDAQFILE